MRTPRGLLGPAMWLCCQVKAIPTVHNTTALTDLSVHDNLLPSGLLNVSALSHTTGLVVENCGLRESIVRYAFLETIETIGFILGDVILGDESSHGFRAMFKSNKSKRTIISILTHMFTMHGMLGLQPAPQALLAPHFACVDRTTWTKYEYLNLGYDPWLRCNSDSESFGKPQTHGFYAEGTAYIFLCRTFFPLQERPMLLASRDCPSVEDNRFVGNQTVFHQRYQIFSIINLLNRFYLRDNALDAKTDPKEAFDWNDCVFRFNALESILNPTNLELYVAFVRQNCMRFPDPGFGPLQTLVSSPGNGSRPETA